MLKQYLDDCPLVAILRGVMPVEVVEITTHLIESGFCIIEVPLNSPDPLESITLISERFSDRALIGAGTVTTVAEVEKVHQAGGKLIFSPNCNLDVIKRTKQLDMVSMPGCCTPSEAFAAIEAGADAIKFFPADIVSPSAVKAMVAVLPPVPMLAVGGIHNSNMQEYLQAGVSGFGIGSSLYKANKPLTEIRQSAKETIEAFTAAKAQVSRA